VLNASGNHLQSAGAGLGALSRLRVLNLSRNAITLIDRAMLL
jgi:Leucine-rich repeat (LRR) protein